jgi:hypothetical protein
MLSTGKPRTSKWLSNAESLVLHPHLHRLWIELQTEGSETLLKLQLLDWAVSKIWSGSRQYKNTMRSIPTDLVQTRSSCVRTPERPATLPCGLLRGDLKDVRCEPDSRPE